MEDDDIGKVIVVCRFRPLNEKEQSQSKSLCVDFSEDKKSVKINSQYEHGQDLNFVFDHVFCPLGTQQEVYEKAAKPIIEAVFQGFNGTVLAYGQTSSGKTYTMSGYDIGDEGIIPRLIKNLFSTIQNSDDSIEFTVKISYCEIYLEKIKDLIDPNKNNLKIQEDKARGVHMPELTETYVINDTEVLELMKIGTNNREVSYTQMNSTSSRSHSIFIITITQNNTKDYSAKSGKLYLVDLAGSEKVGKTGAAGKRLEEAKNINKSLTTLGQVITALTDSKSSHVPYRDSKLTRVLQDSLGGNAKTTLILTCSPSSWNEAETISTLRFGIRAKAIKNKPKVNKEYTVSELKLMLYAAKEEIKKKEKIIESLKGLEVNESRDYSFSVLNFTANEIMETVQQLERTKENLANEVRKNFKLQIENNEKQMALDKEKRENAKISVQLACSKTSVRIFEDEIKVKEENIRVHATKVVLLEQTLENLEGNITKSEGIIKDLTEENEKQRNELKQIHQQIINFKCLESHNLKIQSSLDYEIALNKKQQEELAFLREKLENTITKNANIKELTENIKESISHQEKLRWTQEKMKILSDFERHLKRYELVYEDLKFLQCTYYELQKKVSEDRAEFEKKLKKMQESNDGLRNSYQNLNLKFKEICIECEQEKDKKQRLINKLEILENQINMIKTAENEQKHGHLGVSPLKSENKLIFTNHFRKTIKGGQNLHEFPFSPMKDHTQSISSTVFLSVGKENQYT